MSDNPHADCSSCLGSGTNSVGGSSRELIRVNLCQPLRQLCDESTSTIFLSGALPSINGVFTVTNTSTFCTMTVCIFDAQGYSSYEIQPLSSIAVVVDNVTSISFYCTSVNSCATVYCTGKFEANFYYLLS
jgi:hypothetical protein